MGDESFTSNLCANIEAILYLKGKPTPLTEIVECTNCSIDQVQDAIIKLMSDYAHRDTALEIVETAIGYSLQLRSDYRNLLETLVPAELTQGTLKTLAAIALNSPMLQSDVIALRGSSAYQHINELVELGFVNKRRQDEGRSYWLEIKDKFYHYFEITQLPE